MAALVFVAGLYNLVAVEDMLEEARASAVDSRRSVLTCLLEFALFLIVGGSFGWEDRGPARVHRSGAIAESPISEETAELSAKIEWSLSREARSPSPP